MIKKYPIRSLSTDAESDLPTLLNQIESGTTVHLTAEDGHTAAVIMSLAEYHRLAHGWRPTPSEPLDLDEIIANFQDAFKADGANLDDAFDGIREEWKGRDV